MTLKTRAPIASQDSLVVLPQRDLSNLVAKPPGLTQGTGNHSSVLPLTTVHLLAIFTISPVLLLLRTRHRLTRLRGIRKGKVLRLWRAKNAEPQSRVGCTLWEQV